MKHLILTFLTLAHVAFNQITQAQNPLLEPYNTPHGIIPFETVELEHIKPAFEYALAEARADVQAIIANPEPPTFENTLHAYQLIGERPKSIARYAGTMGRAYSNPELNQLVTEIAALSTGYSNENLYNEALFHRVKAVYEQRESLNLNTEQQTVLENTYLWFARNGSELSDEKKARLKVIRTKISELMVRFGQHVTMAEESGHLHLTDEDELSGLPEWVVSSARHLAQTKEEEGWIIPLSGSLAWNFIDYSDHRQLREKFTKIRAVRNHSDNEFNNIGISTELLNLRMEMAQLLGHANYAEYYLQRTMAQTTQRVYEFLDSYIRAVMPVAHREFEEVQAYARSVGFNEPLQKWDFAYFKTKWDGQNLQFNWDDVKPYLPVDNVINETFAMVKRMWGLDFKINNELPKYHPDLMPYEVFNEQGDVIAVMYMDLFEREGKAWGPMVSSLQDQSKMHGYSVIPVISFICNFPAPHEEIPSLLSIFDLSTFLHELGHALHDIFSDVTYASVSGLNVFRDFVELPSMLLQMWAFEKEYLRLVGRHYETGEPMPDDLLAKIYSARNDGRALGLMQYSIPFCLLDLKYHEITSPIMDNICDMEKTLLSNISFFPIIEEQCHTANFRHIFNYGYAANYYSYDWSDMMAHDIFEVFKQNGIFDTETARRFAREILAKGASEHPMQLFKNFMGREMSMKAFLESFD